jgi:hypothetical protein
LKRYGRIIQAIVCVFGLLGVGFFSGKKFALHKYFERRVHTEWRVNATGTRKDDIDFAISSTHAGRVSGHLNGYGGYYSILKVNTQYTKTFNDVIEMARWLVDFDTGVVVNMNQYKVTRMVPVDVKEEE